MNSARIFAFALLILVPLFSFIFLSSALAASLGDVVINEIMWMGSSASTADEWVELRNMTGGEVDIGGWQLTRKVNGLEDLMLEIPIGKKISASGYFLISNYGKDWSQINVEPDVTDTDVSLANTKLQIKLYDGTWNGGGNLIDTADDGVGAPAAGFNEGDNKFSMARKNTPGDGTDPNSWYTSTASVGFDVGATEKGTPGSENIDTPDEEDNLEITFTLPVSAIAGEGFDVPVTVRNADPSGVYYIKAVVGESTESASLRKGYTYNSVLDKWLAWNGSWEDMPTFTTDADGDASFTLRSKVKDDAATGTYYFLVRIRKMGTDDNLDSSAQTFSVNAASDTSATSGSSDPGVTFSVEDSDLKINQSFDVKVEIKNAKGRHDYYVKIRLGLEEGKLTKGKTYNGFYDKWLADNSSWTNFPVVYTAADGTESITISAKVASGNPVGTYIIGVRLRDKETEDNYDSATQTIVVGEEEVASNEEDNSDGEGEVLGTLTELPATGAGTVCFGYLGLAVGVAAKFILRQKYTTM